MGRLLAGLRSGRFLNRDRVRAYARLFVVLEVLTGLFLVAGTYGLIVPLPGPTSTDFISFYAAGYLADIGNAAMAYDRSAHEAAENTIKHVTGLPYNYFFYPPVFLLLCALLAKLPYLVGYAVFELGSAGFYLWGVRRIIGRRLSLLPFAAFPALGWNLGLGQNGCLTAGLFAAGTWAVDTRPCLAGVFFGCLCYKPHLGFLVPVALIAARRWRCLGAAGVTVLALIGLSGLIFGLDVWRTYIDVALYARQTFEQGRVTYSGLVSPFAAMLVMGGGVGIAYSVQLASTALMILLTAYVWAGGFSLPLRAATLAAATMLSVPVILFYDFMLAALAIAWMIGLASATGFRHWEKAVYCLVGITTILSRGLSLSFSAPIAPLAVAALMAVIWARIREERAGPLRQPIADVLGPVRT